MARVGVSEVEDTTGGESRLPATRRTENNCMPARLEAQHLLLLAGEWWERVTHPLPPFPPALSPRLGIVVG